MWMTHVTVRVAEPVRRLGQPVHHLRVGDRLPGHRLVDASTSLTYPGPAYSTEDAQWTGTAPCGRVLEHLRADRARGAGSALPFNSAGIALLNQWTATLGVLDPNDGFAVVTSLTNAPAYKQFDSYNDGNVASSQGGNCVGDCRPYLQLTYTATSPRRSTRSSRRTTPTSPTLTPELLATGADPDGSPNPSLEYDFIVDNSAGRPRSPPRATSPPTTGPCRRPRACSGGRPTTGPCRPTTARTTRRTPSRITSRRRCRSRWSPRSCR